VGETPLPKHDVKDLRLAADGRQRIEWAQREMPVLSAIRERFARERPLDGHRVSICLHLTAETANLARTLSDGGADVAICGSNAASTQDDVAASLVADFGIATFAIRHEDHDAYYAHLHAIVDHQPQVAIDDGADVIGVLHGHRTEMLTHMIAATEQSTTGVIRLKAIEADGKLAFPVIAVGDAQTKQLFDNRYGTGQSAIDGILRATNVLLAGRTFVVIGYGWCGRGIAERARGAGSHVVVVEVDPLRALQAVMDGYRVMGGVDAARIGDLFCTATGDKHVLRREHFAVMKDGAIVANAGHYNIEVDVPTLESLAAHHTQARNLIDQYVLQDGRRINLIAEGRLVNLAAGEGHPAAVMDMNFANQALSVEYVLRNADQLEQRVYVVPDSIDRTVAALKLSTLGVTIDELTADQERYLASWEAGS
jgi:adenosylhomocysteinase